jgi:hypothetical protein
LIQVINSVIDGKGDPFALLYVAANHHMPMTATALAGAIAKQKPSEFPGKVDSAGSRLNQTLTGLLDSHVYLASLAVLEAKLTKSTTSPAFKAAAAALDTNTVDLSKAIASVYGDAAGKQFLSLWRKHIGFFVDYAVGRLTGNTKQENKAKTDLNHYKKDFAAFLAKATGGNLPANAAAASLQAHVNSLIQVINSVIDGKGDPFALLYVAANHHMPMTATALAGAIIKQYPSRFPTN